MYNAFMKKCKLFLKVLLIPQRISKRWWKFCTSSTDRITVTEKSSVTSESGGGGVVWASDLAAVLVDVQRVAFYLNLSLQLSPGCVKTHQSFLRLPQTSLQRAHLFRQRLHLIHQPDSGESKSENMFRLVETPVGDSNGIGVQYNLSYRD